MSEDAETPPAPSERDAVHFIRWCILVVLLGVTACALVSWVWPQSAQVAINVSLIAAALLLVGSLILWRGEALPGEAEGHRPAEAAALPGFGALCLVVGLIALQCWRAESAGIAWHSLFPTWFLGA